MRSIFFCALLTCLLAGCATGPKVLDFDSNGLKEPLMFPRGAEVPRYLYLGDLTGENNFKRQGEEGYGTARTVFNWLVGLVGNVPHVVELQRPQSGYTDESGRVYVTDVSRQAVFVFDSSLGELKLWEMAEPHVRFKSPVGIASGPQNTLLVADAELGLVARLNADGQPLASFGKGVLKRPTGITRDEEKGLTYVADTHAHDIKVFDDRGELIETIGSHGDGAGQFNFPTHLAYYDDKLFVTDTLNARVQIYSRDQQLENTFGKRGMYVGNMVRPKGVTVDDEGNIYVIESLYDTLLIFNAERQLLMTIGGTGKEAGRFFLPAGIWTDNRNRIYVADMFNGRVSIFQFLGEGK